MDSPGADDIEELTLCSCCQRTFDETERAPKVLACKHHFCLTCTRGPLCRGRELCCVHCGERTALPPAGPAALPTQRAVAALARRLSSPRPPAWCSSCARAPSSPPLLAATDARALLLRDSHRLRLDAAHLAARRRTLLLRALDATTALKLRLEAELAAPVPPDPPPPTTLAAVMAERDRLRARLAEALKQARLDDLVRAARLPLEPELLERALAVLPAPALAVLPAPALAVLPAPEAVPDEPRDPLLFLANYCVTSLYGRRLQSSTPEPEAAPELAVGSPLSRAQPLFYFDVEVNGSPFGRVVIELRADVAPRMARNFAVLATGELGVGYRGCHVFQCWENESVITGDFELNNGRGGRSVFEDSYFMPDDTKLAAVRGAVGMRRSQKRHDHLGLVGSQFRIVLREMRGFTAIFAFVVEGLELVDRLSRAGDSAGKPSSSILIASCGKLN